MKYLMERLSRGGVSFIQKRVDDVSNLFSNDGFDLVVNCTGLGAMETVGDSSMYPIRGQVLRVK